MNLASHVKTYAAPLALGVLLVPLVCASFFYIRPFPDDDSPSYIAAMQYLSGETDTISSPTRILNTAGGLVITNALAPLFGGLLPGWLAMNVFFYFLLAFSFFYLLREFFASEWVALIGTLLLAGNYAPLVFGLGYLMDAGGWALYALSLLFLHRYATSNETRYLWCAAAAVGVGGLFKEYALLGGLAIAAYVFIERYPRVWRAFLQLIPAGVIAALPVTCVHIAVYLTFGYTYLDWVRETNSIYGNAYASRVVEYIKSFGSLLNLLAPLALLGSIYFVHSLKRGELSRTHITYIAAVACSVIPVFFWPGITQRVLFICVPLLVLVAAFFIKRFERQWYLFIPFLVAYVALNVLMDSVILPNLDIPFL